MKIRFIEITGQILEYDADQREKVPLAENRNRNNVFREVKQGYIGMILY